MYSCTGKTSRYENASHKETLVRLKTKKKKQESTRGEIGSDPQRVGTRGGAGVQRARACCQFDPSHAPFASQQSVRQICSHELVSRPRVALARMAAS